MTQANSPKVSLDDERNSLVTIFDDKGRFDPIQTAAAHAEILQESNTVKLPGGGIDPVATSAKRLATKLVVLARRK
jgi:hypothetical protein